MAYRALFASDMEDEKTNSVVLAEDLTLVREGLCRLCEAVGGYRIVFQCKDGASAYESIEQMRPDVAILDLNIPRLFSLEIVRKSRAAGLPTKFVILSVRGDRKLVLEALRSGASAFLLKTASSVQLEEALRQVVAGGIYVSPELELDKIFVTPRRHETLDPLETLSSREYQVFTLLIDGIRAKEIAARLDLSPKTVDTYRASLMRKLDIHDVAGLVKYAIQRELTSVA
jgi:DNA-binding NarL/FixJ family response regulator